MPSKAPQLSGFYDISSNDENGAVLRLKGRVDVKNAALLLKSLKPAISAISCEKLTADLKNVQYMDDYGAMVISEIKTFAESQDVAFEIIHINESTKGVLDLYASTKKKPGFSAQLKPKKRDNVFVRLGEGILYQAFRVRFMVSFLGSVILSFVKICFHPKALRAGDTITHMQKVGVDAVPIVALISFLLGLIMAFVSSIQLRQFGAGIFVASLVALAMVSELGPIMTSIVIAGRSGSAFAAEIGTMRINEEIDALYSMGFAPTLFLAAPRILACLIVVPLLTLFSDMFAIFGGLVISVSMLDLTIGTYISQTISTLDLFEFLWGFSKSIVFAFVISLVGCLRGFQVRGGAAQVGNAATSAVVTSIFLIILFDSIFAVIRSYWG